MLDGGPSCESHSLMVRSMLHDAMVLPVRSRQTRVTQFVCPISWRSCSPLCTSKMTTLQLLPSPKAAASVEVFGENAMLKTVPSTLREVRVFSPYALKKWTLPTHNFPPLSPTARMSPLGA